MVGIKEAAPQGDGPGVQHLFGDGERDEERERERSQVGGFHGAARARQRRKYAGGERDEKQNGQDHPSASQLSQFADVHGFKRLDRKSTRLNSSHLGISY